MNSGVILAGVRMSERDISGMDCDWLLPAIWVRIEDSCWICSGVAWKLDGLDLL